MKKQYDDESYCNGRYFSLPIQPYRLAVCWNWGISFCCSDKPTGADGGYIAKEIAMQQMKSYKEIVDSAPVVLVVFHAHWCPHCRRMHTTVADAEALLDKRVPVYRFDIDDCGDYAAEARIKSIPTFIAYKNGQPLWRYSGELSGDELLGKMEGIINHRDS